MTISAQGTPLRWLLPLWLLVLQAWLGAAEFDQRLSNLSALAQTGAGERVLTAGFVVGQGARKPVLIRVVGPGLADYGVGARLPNPVLRVYNSSEQEIANNDNWSADAGRTVALKEAFAAAGAFALKQGSLDSALVVTLEPGAYTVQATGLGTAAGVTLIEVYDLSGASRLMNLSARSRVSTDVPLMTNGLVVAQGPARRVLVRAVGPTLAEFGLEGVLSAPVLDLRDGQGRTLLANRAWEEGPDASLVASEAARVGAFALRKGSRDAALIATLDPGSYTVLVSGAGGTQGVVLVELYDLSPDSLQVVGLRASVASTDTLSGVPAEFTFTRSGGDLSKSLAVALLRSGTALPGVDFEPLVPTLVFPAGVDQVRLPVVPLKGDSTSLGGRTVELSLASSKAYGLADNRSATVTLFNAPGTLYVSTLRPHTQASGVSVAGGTATLQLSPDGSFALVNVSFANLSSGEVAAHLAVGGPGEQGPYVLALPLGQVSGVIWRFSDTGALTVEDLKRALAEGRLYVSIDSARFPEGELRGQLSQATGTMNFVPPSAPAALADEPLSAAAAARFLTQATFGATQADVDALVGKRRADLEAWISVQQSLPATLHRTATQEDLKNFGQGQDSNRRPSATNRQAAWWKLSVTAPDQLRQRVAFALSEIFVVSDQNDTLGQNQEALAAWYDMLGGEAFGNYRQLLEKVALSPVMGTYLSHLRNRKADPKTGSVPDENFARELMQLFSIGLVRLQPDGSLLLSLEGQPVPTYDNTIIPEMARVFTGFSFHTGNTAGTSFSSGPSDYFQPMTLFPALHDDAEKMVVGGLRLPAGQGGLRDLADTLDALHAHPNTGPFLCRQLIQRLVTSNPSPAYVYRVALVFADNGRGVRGDLGAVVKAILLDPEARSPLLAQAPGFGKLKEPLLRVTGLLRAFGGSAENGRYAITQANAQLGQAALSAPTVFNFFEPAYVLPGDLAAAGLKAPEYQILTDSTSITTPNFLYSFIQATRGPTTIGLVPSAQLAKARDPEALVESVNLLCCAGGMSASTRTRLVRFLQGVPASTSDLERVRAALYLAVAGPEGAVQR